MVMPSIFTFIPLSSFALALCIPAITHAFNIISVTSPTRRSKLHSNHAYNPKHQWPMRTNQNQNPMMIPSSTKLHSSNLSSGNNDRGGGFFYESFLLGKEGTDSETYTHLIGIPLEECHDLLLELESVQRGILYHCPVLFNACIMPVVTRMPLLYVDTSKDGGMGVNRDYATEAINRVVEDVVQDLIYGSTSSDKDGDSSDDAMVGEYESKGMPNAEGLSPLMMKFSNLELDGDKNEVLHTIGMENCDGTSLLRKVVMEIQARMERKGWKTALPRDEPQSEGMEGTHDDNDGGVWRPRVPFMRLPEDFEEKLPPLEDGDDDEEKEEWGMTDYRTPEEGGNGISPIFFYKWWEDEFTKGEGVRLREIAVYGRSGPWGLTEKAFYCPNASTKLPNGNELLSELEEKAKKYADSRAIDAPMPSTESEYENKFVADDVEDQNDIITTWEESNNEWQNKDNTVDSYNDLLDRTKSMNEMMDADADAAAPSSLSQITRKPGDPIIRNIIAPIIKNPQQSPPNPKKKLSDNNDFSRIQEMVRNIGKTPAAPSEAKTTTTTTTTTEEEPLEPYPADPHFVGIWRLLSSPANNPDTPDGSANDISNILQQPIDPTVSDNLILRVDGGISGGPILDREHNQKAAGGDWKWFQAKWAGGGGAPEMEQTRLRIKFVIPPKKTQELVMEGQVTKVDMPSGSNSNTNAMESSSSSMISSLGLPEDTKERSRPDSSFRERSDNDQDAFLHCGGEVWVQDIDGGGNRKKLGRFSAMKLKTPKPDDLRYSIPPPKRGLQE